MKQVIDHIRAHQDEAVEDLRTLLRQESVSAQNIGLEPCARLLRDQMVADGVTDTQILPTEGGPEVVVGRLLNPNAEKTLLCYGHYDVQPPEPLEKWDSDPFGAEIRDGIIYARGATDNKSGCMAFVKAAKAFLQTRGAPPVNLTFLFEGEEEIGSPHLEDFVYKHKDLLQCDASIGLDGGVNRTSLKPGSPPGYQSHPLRRVADSRPQNGHLVRPRPNGQESGLAARAGPLEHFRPRHGPGVD